MRLTKSELAGRGLLDENVKICSIQVHHRLHLESFGNEFSQMGLQKDRAPSIWLIEGRTNVDLGLETLVTH